MSTPSSPITKQPGVVVENQACIHCGYNLRGLSEEGNCPECFTPIQQSLRGDLLKYADPDWLDTLRFGTVLKLWHIALMIAVTAVAVVLVVFRLPLVLLVGLAIIGGGFGVWASFAITTQEPRISLQEDPVTWRKAIRTCTLLSFAGSVLENAAKSGVMVSVWALTGTLLSLAGLVALFGELLYFSRFAKRIPDLRLARSTRIVMWGSTITMTCMILLAVFVVLVGLAPAAAPATAGLAATGGPPATAGPDADAGPNATRDATGTAHPPADAEPAAAGIPDGPVAAPTVTPPPVAPPPVAPPTAMGVVPGLLIGFSCVVMLPGVAFFLWYVFLLVRYKLVFTEAARVSRELSTPDAQI